ncbi:hypothetical protein AURDEDRAFT_162691 [Auricularia subglabra TFB-10046 SS5]|nr:hypothetical protein AURDEDRAFT_162691 [Auricularia subglabra TFB-10046 SS5]
MAQSLLATAQSLLAMAQSILAPLRAAVTTPNTRTVNMPADVILSVIDHVALPQLIRMAHVCHEWRVLAYSHPTFWRMIDVCTVKPAALECMIARLAASDAPIERIFLNIPIDNPAIENVVLPALATHLHRIEHLCTTLHPLKAGVLFHALRDGGPRLKELEIIFHSPRMTMLDHVLLPHDLLGGSAPHLFQFTGGNVRLGSHTVEVFSNVVDVAWQASDTETGNSLVVSPVMLSKHFPRMRDLYLDGQECYMQVNLNHPRFGGQLDTLYLDLGDSAVLPLAFLPAAPPTTITIAFPVGGIMFDALADVAQSVLRCRISCRRDGLRDPTRLFEVELTSLRTNLKRGTLELFDKFSVERTDTPPIFVEAAWYAQVTELVLEHPSRIWCDPGIMKWIPPFPSLRRLILLVDGPGSLGQPAAKLLCPTLKSIIVTPLSSAPLHREVLLCFLRDGLVSPAEHVTFSSGDANYFASPAKV